MRAKRLKFIVDVEFVGLSREGACFPKLSKKNIKYMEEFIKDHLFIPAYHSRYQTLGADIQGGDYDIKTINVTMQEPLFQDKV